MFILNDNRNFQPFQSSSAKQNSTETDKQRKDTTITTRTETRWVLDNNECSRWIILQVIENKHMISLHSIQLHCYQLSLVIQFKSSLFISTCRIIHFEHSLLSKTHLVSVLVVMVVSFLCLSVSVEFCFVDDLSQYLRSFCERSDLFLT